MSSTSDRVNPAPDFKIGEAVRVYDHGSRSWSLVGHITKACEGRLSFEVEIDEIGASLSLSHSSPLIPSPILMTPPSTTPVLSVFHSNLKCEILQLKVPTCLIPPPLPHLFQALS